MFKVFFNRKKQWLDVEVWDVHPTTFARWEAGRWGYFLPEWKNPAKDKFGELHFVERQLRTDTLVHESFHVLVEWMWANRTNITSRNEEKLATMQDEIYRRILRELLRQGYSVKL